MAQRALDHEKIEPIWNSTIKEYITNDKGDIQGVLLENTQDGSTSELEVEGVFMAIGHTPNSSFLNGLVETDDQGYILQKHGTLTSVDGIYAAGDISDTEYRQAITAAGQGCAAAIEVERWIADQE